MVVVLLIVSCFLSVGFVQNAKNPIYNLNQVERCCIVSQEKFFDDAIQNGKQYFNFCSFEEGKSLLNTQRIEGFQVYLGKDRQQEVEKMLNLQIVDRQIVEDIEVIYAYTQYWNNAIMLKNKKVNVQIALSKGQMIIGFPLILTGY